MLYAEVISGLWICDIDLIYNKKFLQDNDIGIIINCTTNYHFPDFKNIQKVRLPLSDNLFHNLDTLRDSKDKILLFIDQALDDYNIMIACYDGKTISPFLISLYLIHYGGISKDNIRKIIQSKNTEISMDYGVNLLDL
jgi:hypothetical protein